MAITRRLHRSAAAIAAGLCLASHAVAATSRIEQPGTPAAPAGQAAPQPSRPTFKSGLDLVVVNVVVRDKDGRLVRALTRDDFVVLEDGKPQTVTSFDFEEIEKHRCIGPHRPGPLASRRCRRYSTMYVAPLN